MPGIQRKIVVFAIALTFWGNAHATTSNTTLTQNDTQIPCSVRHVEYKNAAEAAYKAFDDLVNFTMNNPSMDKTPYITKLNQSLIQFLEDSYTYCSPNVNITTENFSDYLNVVKFSMRNVTVLKDLERDGAFQCILNQKSNINQCIKEKVNENITLHNNYSRLHAKSHLNFNLLACIQTKNVKPCVLKVIEDNNCDKATDYVKSLFDFVISKHCENVTETNASVKITENWSLFILVSFWNALALYKS